MPVINRIAAFADDMKTWRQHIHAHPELGFDCFETAGFVKERLSACGVDEIHDQIATTGIVAIIQGSTEGPTFGLRADMDALPLSEETGADWASTRPGTMHACGHDGHTTMLLGAARYLAETRNFAGRVALIFQPAEEGGGGGQVMVEAGIMERFGIDQVYGIHNVPETEEGSFYTAPGALLAGADAFTVDISGRGGHGAYPQETADPVVAAVAIVNGFQTIVSRNHHPMDELIVSVTQIHAGTADNIIPGHAMLNGTVRTFDAKVQDMVMRRMAAIVAGTAAAYDVTAELDYEKGYPATVNHADQTAFAVEVAREIAGADRVQDASGREMGAEDFAYMLNARPGAYVFLGAGPGAALHNPSFDFNDAISPVGASYFARLVERAQPLA